jgi:hypothetical protein
MLRVKFEKKNKKIITEGIKAVSDHIDQGDIEKIKKIFRDLLEKYKEAEHGYPPAKGLGASLFNSISPFQFKNIKGEDESTVLYMIVGPPNPENKVEDGAMAIYYFNDEDSEEYHILKVIVKFPSADIDEEYINKMINYITRHELVHLIESRYSDYSKFDKKRKYLAKNAEILAFSSQIYADVVEFLNSNNPEDINYRNILFGHYRDKDIDQRTLFKALLMVSDATLTTGILRGPRFIKNAVYQHTMKDKQPYLKHLYKKLWPMIQEKLKDAQN